MDRSATRPAWASRPWPPHLLAAACALLALAYVACCLGGLKLAIVHPSITTVWPGTGVAQAALLVLGYRVWPGIFLGALLTNLAIAGQDGPGILACLGIAGGNTLEGWLGAFLVNRFANGCRAFEKPRNIFRYVFLAALLSPVVSATCGVLCLGTAWQNAALPWGAWWLGDAVGSLIVAPPLILWSVQPRIDDWSRRNLLQAAASGLGLVLVALVVFADWLMPREPNFPLAFVCLPLVIWVAFHFGQRGIATITLLFTVVAAAGMQAGYASRPLSQPVLLSELDGDAFVRFKAQVLLQSFLGLTAITGLTLAAVVTERNRTDAELQAAHSRLERRVDERTADLARSNLALRHENVERQRAEQKFRDLLEAAPDAMVIADAHGRIVLVNAQAEKMFGYGRAEMLGQAVELLVPAALAGQHQRHRRQYFVEPGVRPMGVGMRLHGRHKDGHEFPVEISLSPLQTEEGILVSSAIRDVSSRQQTEDKLRQTERLAAIGETIAGLAHECRNTLQQSQACLELLALKLEDRPDLANLVADCQKAQDHLHHLYEEVRGYAAPIKLLRQPHDLGRLLGDAWNALEHVRRGRATHLIQAPASATLACDVDARSLGQVLTNVLQNCLEACPGAVEIRANWTDAMLAGKPALRLSLIDNGPGLSADDRERIFQPFFSTKTQGTGLGLAITRRIVEAHGGVIEVGALRNPGLEMVITLPRHGD